MPHNDLIFKKLAEVIDPELGIDIVQLGLIRSVEVSDNNFIKFVMTLTTPMCPFADMIIED
jgi:metal-sulfur cluster biosynthetic enzyme